MSVNLRGNLFKCCIAIPLVATTAWTQQPMARSIARSRVPPGRVGECEAAVKDLNGILKQAGWKHSHTLWVSTTGPREYADVTYAPTLAALQAMNSDPQLKDFAPQMTAVWARINACVENNDRIIDKVLPELSILSNDIPRAVRVLRVLVKPGQTNEFRTLVKDELIPAGKKAGVKFYQVSQTGYGGPSSEFRLMLGLDGWSDLDGPSVFSKAMGDEKWASFQKKFQSLTLEAQYDVYWYRPDLSYTPAPATSTR